MPQRLYGRIVSLSGLATVLAWTTIGCGTDSATPQLAGENQASGLPAIAEWTPGRHGAWHGAPPASVPPNLLLITLDTTRQDHLGCYGFETEITPHLDRLADEGVVFTRGTTPVPVTLPAHTTMMTGLYPFHHSVRNNGTYATGDSLRTLAEALSEAGYRTGAILAAFPLATQFGLDQGFDHYDDAFPGDREHAAVEMAQRPGNQVTELSLAWIDGRDGRVGNGSTVAGADDRDQDDRPATGEPFFLWAHYFDPHYPYTPPEPYLQQFPGSPYAGEVAFMDAQIGALLEGLRKRDLYERTLIVVVGDHGESLGEHGEATHSIFVYNATQYVPFLFRLPGGYSGKQWNGRRVDGLVSLVDIFPTVIDALGLPREMVPPGDGISLLPVAAGDAGAHAWVYYETLVPQLEYGASDLRAIETATWKYIRAPRPELYHLQEDPAETSNRAQRESWHVEELETDLAHLLRGEGEAPEPLAMDAETIEKLQSLGYLAGVDRPRSDEMVDPKDMIGSLRLLNEAAAHLAAYRAEDALALADSILQRFPRDGRALRLRATSLVQAGRHTEAIEAFDTALSHCDHCPDQAELLLQQAVAISRTGDPEDALRRLGTLHEIDPELPSLEINRARILLHRGSYAEARAAAEGATRRKPDEIEPWLVLAEIETAAGDPGSAETAFRTALGISPRSAEALIGLGALLAQTQGASAARPWIDQAYDTDPNLPEVLFSKAWLAVQDGRGEDALRFYTAGLERAPNDADALFSAGTVHLSLGRPQRALELFGRSIATGRAPVGAFANTGVVYAQLGRLGDAVGFWEQALDMNPGDDLRAQIQQNLDRARAQLGSR